MKKICLLLSFILLFSTTGCSNNKNAPEFWEEESTAMTQGEYDDLTEEYYSYVKSVQSQFEKQNGVELEYQYIVPIDESAKRYTVFFEEKESKMKFYIECVRNNMGKTNYNKALIEKQTLEELKKPFVNGKYIHEDLGYNSMDADYIFDFEFEVVTDEMNLPEDFKENPKFPKVLRVTMTTDRLKKNICNESFFNYLKASLGGFANVEMKKYNNVEIQTTIKNCGFMRLKRANEENAVTYKKYEVMK